MALERGHSKRMGHLRKYGEVSVSFLAQLPIDMEHLPGVDQLADLFTKPLSAAPLGFKSMLFLILSINISVSTAMRNTL